MGHGIRILLFWMLILFQAKLALANLFIRVAEDASKSPSSPTRYEFYYIPQQSVEYGVLVYTGTFDAHSVNELARLNHPLVPSEAYFAIYDSKMSDEHVQWFKLKLGGSKKQMRIAFQNEHLLVRNGTAEPVHYILAPSPRLQRTQLHLDAVVVGAHLVIRQPCTRVLLKE